ncbi:MAG: gamma-glutamyl-gamma-aminobutyrate hydrolase family protein [Hylemonella sp.]|uniref:gamma-glutamyl-gamma-aminobutyrate hydrolase family protein n=1 Tax=Hylemonella sp. TaxID=2066020 RepID=UPI0022C39473|nr:gamma-glutamyl-gamma-aminobutyrate hydrolase family protein [Hylemonella sp.]MCZ8251606.1 gamma-glutamyl-gamma-aminobutyrate hydrolase family protein [Hylemonella sp.]
MSSRPPLRIGLSARIFHPEPGASGIKTKTLLVYEQSVAQWAMSRDVLLLMVPSVVQGGELIRSNIRLRDYAQYLDGLILQGGADVSPRAYGEEPLRSEWSGDPVRDAYELELVHEFMEAGKPILGICRGMQLLNVALGGSLYQDLRTQRPDTHDHESGHYDRHVHRVSFAEDGLMRGWFGERSDGQVVSIHHQGVHRLGRDMVVEALSSDDGVIEAIRWNGGSFVCGVQWHPEFHSQAGNDLLDCSPLLEAFLAAAQSRLPDL